MTREAFVTAVEVTRGSKVESRHRAALVAVDADGRVMLQLGDPSACIWWRSAAKPFQLLACVTSGAAEAFDLGEADLAIACGSHGGEEQHVQAVRALLARAGVGAEALRCGPHPPMHGPSARALSGRGEEPSVLHNNCSGKHAAMLALARHLGDDPSRYLEATSLVQERILAAVSGAGAVPAGEVETAIDGCSAPTFSLPLVALGRAYARLAAALADPAVNPPLGRIAAAMAAQPELVGGTARFDTAVARACPGRVLSKVGAEGVHALALAGPGPPLGVALKIADGADRARIPLALAAMRRLDRIAPDAALDLGRRFAGPLVNHRGLEVGEIRVDPSIFQGLGR
jgi:L-asparaginase II